MPEKKFRAYFFADSHMIRLADGTPFENDLETFEYPIHKPFHKAHTRLEEFINKCNKEKPDVVLGLGDFVGDGGSDYLDLDYERFTDILSNLDRDIPVNLTIGNHEYDYSTAYEDILIYLGYKYQTEIAGSAFNGIFLWEKGDLSVKIIIADTTFNHNREHARDGGHCSVGFFQWLKNQLATDADAIFLCSHHTIHSFRDFGYFSESDARAIKLVVDDSGKMVHHVGAHTHPYYRTSGESLVMHYFNLGRNFPAYTLPALISPGPVHYSILEVDASGEIEYRELGLNLARE